MSIMREKTESIRKEIKAMGYNSRTVSVRSDSNSINVVLKKLIAIKPIKKYATNIKVLIDVKERVRFFRVVTLSFS